MVVFPNRTDLVLKLFLDKRHGIEHEIKTPWKKRKAQAGQKMVAEYFLAKSYWKYQILPTCKLVSKKTESHAHDYTPAISKASEVISMESNIYIPEKYKENH